MSSFSIIHDDHSIASWGSFELLDDASSYNDDNLLLPNEMWLCDAEPNSDRSVPSVPETELSTCVQRKTGELDLEKSHSPAATPPHPAEKAASNDSQRQALLILDAALEQMEEVDLNIIEHTSDSATSWADVAGDDDFVDNLSLLREASSLDILDRPRTMVLNEGENHTTLDGFGSTEESRKHEAAPFRDSTNEISLSSLLARAAEQQQQETGARRDHSAPLFRDIPLNREGLDDESLIPEEESRRTQVVSQDQHVEESSQSSSLSDAFAGPAMESEVSILQGAEDEADVVVEDISLSIAPAGHEEEVSSLRSVDFPTDRLRRNEANHPGILRLRHQVAEHVHEYQLADRMTRRLLVVENGSRTLRSKREIVDAILECLRGPGGHFKKRIGDNCWVACDNEYQIRARKRVVNDLNKFEGDPLQQEG